jgi:acyl carrier protein
MKDQIISIIDKLRLDKHSQLTLETPLVGSSRILDSLLLVELCLKLEDLAVSYDFNFDWTSSEAMSKSASMFRNIGTLVGEFESQHKLRK